MQKLRKELIVVNGIKIKLKYEDLKEFIKITESFESDIDIGEGNCVYDGKSLMAYYSLDLSKPFSIKLLTDSNEENERFKKAIWKYAMIEQEKKIITIKVV